MRRALPVVVALAAAAGCGGDDKPTAGAAPTATPTPAATQAGAAAAQDPGRRVFLAQGCATCHTLTAAGTRGSIGPDLGKTLKGKGADYIREGIIAPNAATAPGFANNAGLMPDDYVERIEPAGMDALVSWLERVT
jgi:mono/diheme cytochrome c family protein